MAYLLTKKIKDTAHFFSIIGDTTRLRMVVYLLDHTSASVSDMAEVLKISIALASHHLHVLQKNNLVHHERRGNKSIFTLTSNPLIKMIKTQMRVR